MASDESVNPYLCQHPQTRLTKRKLSGSWHVVVQCVRCGLHIRTEKKHRHNLLTLPEFDEELQPRLRREMMDRWHEQRQQEVEDFWGEYDAWINSPGWQDLRRRVLERARKGGPLTLPTCEGCGQRPATEVHHLHYRHQDGGLIFGREMLWDLAAVCEECHARLHEGKQS